MSLASGAAVAGVPSKARLVAAAAVGAVTIAVVVLLAVLDEVLERPSLRAVLFTWITVPYLISGILAWWRRPASRLGPLMVATSYAMTLTALQWSSIPAVASIGHLFDMLPAALFVHVFLAYPAGRLETRVRRWIVVAAYGVTVGLQIAKLALGISPDEVFAVIDAPGVAAWVEDVQLGLMSLLLLAATAVLLARPHPVVHRRVIRLLVDAFALALLMLAVLYVAGLAAWPHFEVVRLITFAALGLAPVVFLTGLLDARLARADVGALVVELRADPTGDLRGPLARALHDPSLRLAYWLPDHHTWADPDGHPIAAPAVTTPKGAAPAVPTPAGTAGRAVRVIERDGEPVVALEFDRSLDDEHELVDAVTAAAGIALENSRLQAELRARLHDLAESRARVLEAGRTERRRLERDLHDGAQQRLVAVSLELGLLAARTDRATGERLRQVRTEVAASLEELRDVAHGIYPAVLTGHGLAVALESLAARSVVPVELSVGFDDRLPEPVEVAAYYLVSESLTNIGKHAQATTASVTITKHNEMLSVVVTDDGVGGTEAGSGLRGLADRVEALGGRLRISSPAGGGTRLEAEIPCG